MKPFQVVQRLDSTARGLEKGGETGSNQEEGTGGLGNAASASGNLRLRGLGRNNHDGGAVSTRRCAASGDEDDRGRGHNGDGDGGSRRGGVQSD